VLVTADASFCGLLKILAGIPFKKAFLWGCLSLLIPPATIAYGALIERNLFKVKNVEIIFEELPEAFDGYTIVHISDIHARSFEGRENRLQKAVDKINALDSDIIAFTGDLISMNPDELEDVTDILGDLKAKDGVFSVLGNHDYCMYSDMSDDKKKESLEELMAKQREMGWKLLMNENFIIGRGRDSVAVVGVENTSPSRHFPSKGNLTQAATGTEGMFRILLSHDPLHWESEIIGQDFPLTLSGHTHSMQFSLLGWSPSRYIFPQYRGLYSRNSQYLYVNPGLGETIFPARIGVMPEITLITLRKK
jgi:predicted MPP superfamily phosphohydrolase